MKVFVNSHSIYHCLYLRTRHDNKTGIVIKQKILLTNNSTLLVAEFDDDNDDGGMVVVVVMVVVNDFGRWFWWMILVVNDFGDGCSKWWCHFKKVVKCAQALPPDYLKKKFFKKEKKGLKRLDWNFSMIM